MSHRSHYTELLIKTIHSQIVLQFLIPVSRPLFEALGLVSEYITALPVHCLIYLLAFLLCLDLKLPALNAAHYNCWIKVYLISALGLYVSVFMGMWMFSINMSSAHGLPVPHFYRKCVMQCGTRYDSGLDSVSPCLGLGLNLVPILNTQSLYTVVMGHKLALV